MRRETRSTRSESTSERGGLEPDRMLPPVPPALADTRGRPGGRRDVSDAMQRGFVRCMNRPYPGTESGPEDEGAAEGEETADHKDSHLASRASEGEEEEQQQVTLGELFESQARAAALAAAEKAAVPKTAKEIEADQILARCNRQMAKAYLQTQAMREEQARAHCSCFRAAALLGTSLWASRRPTASSLTPSRYFRR